MFRWWPNIVGIHASVLVVSLFILFWYLRRRTENFQSEVSSAGPRFESGTPRTQRKCPIYCAATFGLSSCGSSPRCLLRPRTTGRDAPNSQTHRNDSYLLVNILFVVVDGGRLPNPTRKKESDGIKCEDLVGQRSSEVTKFPNKLGNFFQLCSDAHFQRLSL